MKVLYLRYNKSSVKKLEKELNELKDLYDDVVLVPVTSGKKLLNKEIKEIESLFNKYNIDQLEIKYLEEEELNKLPNYIKEKTKIFNDENELTPSKEVKLYFEILQELKKRELNISKDVSFFQKILGKKSKQTYHNYMNKLFNLFYPLIQKEHRRDGVYYFLRDKDNIIKEILNKIDDVTVIMQILSSLSDEEIENLSQKTKKIIKDSNKEILFITKPFENLTNYDKKIFRLVKKAIKERRFVDILGYEKPILNLKGYDSEDYYNVVPLKILYMENNWYLAGVVDEIVRFFRISFIDDVIIKDKIPKGQIKKEYLEFLHNVKSPFVLYNIEPKKAILKVSKDVVFYFERKDMFSNQKIINKDPNNFLIEVKYYQYLEIAPIIKKWIPHIQIVECEDDLKDKLKKELQQYLQIL